MRIFSTNHLGFPSSISGATPEDQTSTSSVGNSSGVYLQGGEVGTDIQRKLFMQEIGGGGVEIFCGGE